MLFVTSNPGKINEAREIIPSEIEQSTYDYTEIQSSSLEEIARMGVIESYSELGKSCFVDDSGLFIDELNGFPGPYSSYVHGTIGNKGVLRAMNGVDERSAVFRCVVAYMNPGLDSPMTFKGEVNGAITHKEKGDGGFGYDPIFRHEDMTFAEMSQSDKNEVSHRRRALQKFSDWIQQR